MNPPRRPGLKDISDLFISRTSASAEDACPPFSENETTTARSPRADDGCAVVGLAHFRPMPEALYLALGFGRWLLPRADHVTLVTPPPSERIWNPIAERFALPATAIELIPDRPALFFRIHDALDLILTDRMPLDPAAQGRETDAIETHQSFERGDDEHSQRRVVVQVLNAWTESGARVVGRCDLVLALLQPDVAAFVQYYQWLKAAGAARADARHGIVLDAPGRRRDLPRIEQAWQAIGGRFLNAPGRVLGQIDASELERESAPFSRKLRLCEEGLDASAMEALMDGRAAPLRQARQRFIDDIAQCAARGAWRAEGESNPPGKFLEPKRGRDPGGGP